MDTHSRIKKLTNNSEKKIREIKVPRKFPNLQYFVYLNSQAFIFSWGTFLHTESMLIHEKMSFVYLFD